MYFKLVRVVLLGNNGCLSKMIFLTKIFFENSELLHIVLFIIYYLYINAYVKLYIF